MDFGGYLQFLVALIFVLGLIGLCGVLLRRLAPGMRARRLPGAGRRLEVLEILPVDARRRLVMVRRDGVGHLLLVGLNDDRVIETGFDAEAPPPPPGAAAADGDPRGAGPDGEPGAGFRRLVERFSAGRRP